MVTARGTYVPVNAQASYETIFAYPGILLVERDARVHDAERRACPTWRGETARPMKTSGYRAVSRGGFIVRPTYVDGFPFTKSKYGYCIWSRRCNLV